VADLGVQAVRLLEQPGRAGQVALGGRGPGEGVEGQGLGLEVVVLACLLTGILIPVGLEAASLTNFAGYVAWCLWLIAMAVILWRTPRAAADRQVPAPVS
jgi:hypothetical protein